MSQLQNPGREISLTDKQIEVLERLERRLTISEIAFELRVSDSAVNQRIRVLKLRLRANTHRGLVERFRQLQTEGCRDSAGRIPQLSEMDASGQTPGWDDQGSIFRFEDSLVLPKEASGSPTSEPKVVPGVLDGEHAGRLRLAVIVSIVFGTFAAIVLALAAARAITDLI